MKDICVKNIPLTDMDQVVKVHDSAFKGFFMTELGDSFLKTYYSNVAKSPEGILLGAYNNTELIGFCAACKKAAGFNSGLIKNNLFSFGTAGLRILFTRPGALLRLYKNLTKTGNNQDNGDYAELMSIAVSEKAQNTGAGKALVNQLENDLVKDGISSLSLTTDVHHNEKSLAFYRKRGFEQMYRFTTYPDREMYRLIKNLHS